MPGERSLTIQVGCMAPCCKVTSSECYYFSCGIITRFTCMPLSLCKPVVVDKPHSPTIWSFHSHIFGIFFFLHQASQLTQHHSRPWITWPSACRGQGAWSWSVPRGTWPPTSPQSGWRGPGSKTHSCIMGWTQGNMKTRRCDWFNLDPNT